MSDDATPGNVPLSDLLGPLLDEARSAGAEVTDYVNYAYGEDVAVFAAGALAAFVRRVQAAERERCARLCDKVAANHRAANYGEFPGPMLTTTGELGAEECAKAIRDA